MATVEDLLGAGALAFIAKKLIEGAKTTYSPAVGTATSRFFGTSDPTMTQAEYQKGLQTFLQDLSAGSGAYAGNGLETGYKKDYDPKQQVSLFQGGAIDLTMPLDIQNYVGPSTFKFGTKIDNSGKLSL